MTPLLRIHALVATFIVGVLASTLAAQSPAGQAPAGQTIRHQEAIAAYAAEDRTIPPPPEGILFIGSSIFRQWSNVKEHMAPLPAFNRAFGGSRTWEVLHYMDQVVLPYRPRVIVYYCGSNDINAGEKAPAIVGRFHEFLSKVHATLPGTRVLFVSVLKAPQKRTEWATVEAVNERVKAMASTTPYLGYVELNPVVFNASGEPRLELYRPDGLHYHPPAYDEFAAVIRPEVEKAWAAASASGGRTTR